MSQYIPDALRRLVAERAGHRCEYCRLSAIDSFFAFHIDHIISLKHGGATIASNLAYACQICNLNKGTDIYTFLNDPTLPVRFFNPRADIWTEHFEADASGAAIAKTPIGGATIKILDLNYPESVIERREMVRFGML